MTHNLKTGMYDEAGFKPVGDPPPIDITRQPVRHVSAPGGNISNTATGGRLKGGSLNEAKLSHDKFRRKYGRSYRRKKRS